MNNFNRLARWGLVALLLALAPAAALAQSTAEPVVPGYLTTIGCRPGFLSCFVPYGPSGPSGATSTPPVTIQQTATASAVQLASNQLTNGVIFYIPSTNTGTICVGKDNTVTTLTGYCMSTANGIPAGSLGVNNTNLIWVIGTNTSDILMILGN